MLTIKRDLPKTIDELELYIFSDEHIGDKMSDLEYLKERIDHVKNTPNCYALLNGDIINNATKTSISDIYSETMMPQEQIDLATELFKPIANKILAVTGGNHEARTYKKEGIDPMKVISTNLGIEKLYSPVAIFLFLRFGENKAVHKRRMCYSIYMTHGSGGGRKEGAKIIRLCDLAAICDFDVGIHSHSHLGIIAKEAYYRVCTSNSSIQKIDKLFVNTSANLDYGGYGEVIGCKPSSIVKPVIHLDGHKRSMSATL